MKVTCNVMLLLMGYTPRAKMVKLASIDITEQMITQSNRLDQLDDSASIVADQALTQFKEEHPELGESSLTCAVTVQVW